VDVLLFDIFDNVLAVRICEAQRIASCIRVQVPVLGITDFVAGFAAWLAWLLVHLYFLIGFRNRLVVLINSAWSYFTYGRGARLITGRRLALRPRRPAVPARAAG
jgi:NADH dehydrogenase FAD-containing subunit